VVLGLVGRGVLDLFSGDGGQPPGRAHGDDLVLAPLAGLLVLHLLLTATTLSGAPWSRLTVTLPLVALDVVAVLGLLGVLGPGRVRGRRRDEPAAGLPDRRRFAVGWGDAVAALCLLGIGVLALLRRIAASDFIYHWGLKGERFALVRGIDVSLLAAPWNRSLHPDYPNLVPGLFAATAITEGSFRESTVLLWSVVATALLLLAARRLLLRTMPDAGDTQIAFAALALGITSFSISWQMMGNADAWMALAVVLAVSALVGEPPRDLAVGLVAALAAAAKIEGVALAGLLVVLHLLRRRARGRVGAAALARMIVPPALVIAPWVWSVAAHDLSQGYTSAGVEPGRLLAMPGILLDSLLHDGWHGLSLLVLAVVLVLPLFRRFRVAGLLLLTQLAFYLAVYVTTTGDMELLVRTTAPRLLYHLLPAALVLGAALLPGSGEEAAEPQQGRASALPEESSW
jgi:hypothetical protein